MAKDFVDTQTGGEGATAQTGNLSASEMKAQVAAPPTTSKRTRKGLKKQARQDKREDRQRDRKRRREDRKENREDRRDYRKEERKYGGRVKDSEEDDLPQEEFDAQGAGIRTSQAGGQLNEEDLISAEVDGELEPETPMVQPLESLDAPQNQSNSAGFSFSVGVDEEDEVDDSKKYNEVGAFNFSTGDDKQEGLELLSLPEGMKPYEPGPESPAQEEEEIYVYGNSPNEYVIRNGRWWAKTPNQSEFQPIIGKKAVARMMGLNESARSKRTGKPAPKIDLPESTFKPKRGAFTEVEGVPIYQMPGNVNRLYTVRDNEIYVLEDGDKEWKRMEDTKSKYDIDARIKSFNDFHGMSIPTKSELKKKQAQIDAKNAAPMSTTAEAGEALKERQADFEDVNLDIRYDENGDAIISTGDGSDLFGAGQRPKSNVHTFNQSTSEQYEWDSQYGPLLPASEERVELAKVEKNNANQYIFDQVDPFWIDDVKHNEDGYPIAETIVLRDDTPIATVNTYNDLLENYLPGFDEKIKQEEKAVEAWNESFRNRSDYISKNGLPSVSNNYLQDLERRTRYDNYGMYQEDAVEKVNEAMEELRKYKRERNKERLEKFANRNLDEWNLTNNLGKEQLDQLKGMQEQIKKGGIFMFDDSGYMERNIKEFIEESFDINNKLGDAQLAGQDLTDYILDNRKIAYSDAKKAGLISDEVADVFESTMNLREFMQPYINRGYIDVDEETGRYEISPDTPQMEREYIESQLDILTNKYDNAKSKIYVDNTKAIEKLQKDLKSKKAAIKRANQGLKEGKIPKEQMKSVSAELNQLDQEIKDIESKIDELRQNNVITFQTDPKKMAAKMSGLTTQSSEAILRALPQDATGFHKFALFYENLKKRTERMKYEYNISEDYRDRVGEKVRDMLDISELGLKLSSQEKEYFKNQALLQQALPLYLNNDWGITEESAGFWDSFMNSLYGTVFPHTSKAYGFYNETEMASGDMRLIEAAGLSEVDFADAATMEKLQARLDIDFWSWETWGNMVGTSTAIMMAIIGGGGIMGGGIKGGKAVISLLDKYKKAKRTADAIRDLQRITNSYHKSLKATRLGRFALESTKSGIQFEVSSTFNTMDDELNFLSGLGGAMGAKIAGGIFGKLKVSEGIDWLTGIFGSNSTRAAQVFKNIGNSSWGRTMKAANYRGLGEMPEEFSQELVSIYRDELRERGFFIEVFDRYIGPAGENLDELFELAMASYVLGASMGTALSTTQQDYYESLSPAKKKILQQIQKEVTADMLSASVDADMTAEQISRELDAELGTEKQTEDAVQEQQTEEVDVDEQARDGREMDEEGEADQTEEEGAVKTPERKGGELIFKNGRLYKVLKGYDEAGNPMFYEREWNMSQEAIQQGIESGQIIDESVKPADESATTSKVDFQDFISKAKEDGLTLDEAAARAEQEGTFDDDIDFQKFMKKAKEDGLTLDEAINRFNETKDMSLADRIRALKLGKDPNTLYSSIIPTSLINKAVNTALETAALTVENVQKVIDYVKGDSWYTSKTPEQQKAIDAELEQLRADLENKEAVSATPKTLEEIDITVSDKLTEEERDAFNESLGKGVESAKRKGYEVLAEPLLVETADGLIAVYNQDLESYNGEKFGVKVHKKKDGSIGKRVSVLDNEAVETAINESSKFLSPKRVKPTEAVKSIKEKIAQFRRGYIEGEKAQKKLSKDEIKAKKDAVEQIQKELMDYVTQNLPKKSEIPEGGSYNKQDIKTMMSKIRDAKPENLEAAVDAVDKIVNRFAEQERKNTAKRVVGKFTNPQIKERGGKKVSRITPESRADIKALGEQIGLENIPNMTQEELDALEETVDNMIAGGKEAIKAKEESKSQERREERAVPLDILTRQLGKKRVKVSGNEIRNLLKSKQGIIIHDGQKFSGASTFEEYLDKKGLDIDSVGELEAVLFNTSKIFARQKQADTRGKKAKNWASRKKQLVTEVSNNFDNKMEWIYRGSKTLRDWTKKNIIDLKNKAFQDKANGIKTHRSKIADGMKKIWGEGWFGTVPKGWSDSSGVTIKAEGVELTNGQLVNAYMMSLTGAQPIYEVNGALYITEAAAKKAVSASMPKGTKKEEIQAIVNDSVLTDKWNPSVLIQMSPNFAKEGQLSYEAIFKAEEIEDAIKSDGKLDATTKLLRESFDEMRADFEPVFKEMYDAEFKETDTYFPLSRSSAPEMDYDILSEDNISAASAMADNLKKRHHNSSEIDFGYDALSKTYNYISQMNHAKAFMPVAENMRNLMNPSTKALITEKIGADKVQLIQEHMDAIINGGDSKYGSNRALNWWASHTVVTTLMLKTASVPKQLTSMFHYYGAGLDDGVSVTSVAYESARFLGNATQMATESLAKKAVGGDFEGKATTYSDKEIDVIKKIFTDAFLSDRVSSLNLDTETRAIIQDMIDTPGKAAWKKMQRIALLPTVLGDAGGVIAGGVPFTIATYNNNVQSKGMSHEEAMADAVTKFISVSEKTQQSRRDDIVTAAQRDSAYRLFLTYTTSQVAAASQVSAGFKVVRGYFKGSEDPITGEKEYTRREAVNGFRKMLYFSTFGNLTFNLVSGGYIGMLLMGLGYEEGDDELTDAEFKKKHGRTRQEMDDLFYTAIYDSIGDMISSDLQGWGLPGKLVDGFLNEIRGRGFFNEIPILKRMDLFRKSGASLMTLFFDLNRLYAEGTITSDEYWDSLLPEGLGGRQLDRPEKTMDDFYEFLGAKNINGMFDSWGQYMDETDDKDLGFWDAFMGRKIGEDYETGEARPDVYYTGRERKELAKKMGQHPWLYDTLFPDKEPYDAGSWVSEERQEEFDYEPGDEVESLEEELLEGLPENQLLEDMSEADPSDSKYVSEDDEGFEYKKQYRKYEDIKERILQEREWAKAKTDALKKIEVMNAQKPVEDAAEKEQRIREEIEEKTESVKKNYKEVTGKEPDPSWDLDKTLDEMQKHVLMNMSE